MGGTVETLDAVNGALPLGRGVCSRNGFSIIDDTNSMLLNDEGWVEVRQKNIIDCYFFGYGFEYLKAIKDYYRLTGIPPLLPAYALGNWWSRFHKYTQEEYLTLIDRFMAEDIPFSVGVIDMDWHTTVLPKELTDNLNAEYNGMSSGWTGYSWNEDLFPDYKQMLKDLKQKNLKIALSLHPTQGVRKHETMFKQMAEAMGLDPEKEFVVPFDILSPKFMKNYFDILHHPYEKDGVDFWWMDYQQGTDYWWIHKKNDTSERDPREILNPLWLLNHLHILDISSNGKRPMFFSRYSGVGSHRYPVGFSGDTMITWESLKFQPYFTTTASNIGYSWWSHDIGGHLGGFRDEELTTRWVQLGVFSPINRLHSGNSDFIRKEPWCYEEKYEKILKDYLRLRHQLFPYIYTMNFRNHTELEPLIQPMYYAYPKCSGAYEVPNQFWFGSELMVAPITEPCDQFDKLGSVETWFPKGDWFDFFDGTHYFSEKHRKVEVFRDIKSIPVFAKAGAIIPLSQREMGDNKLSNLADMCVDVFPGASNEFNLYEDSGDGYEYQNGKFALTNLKLDWGKTPQFTINPAQNDISLIPNKRNWTINFKGFNKNICVSVYVNDVLVDSNVEITGDNIISVAVSANVTDKITISINGDNLITDNENYIEKCFKILQNSKVDFGVKNTIFNIINDDKKSLHTKMFNVSNCSKENQHLARAIREQHILTKDEFKNFNGWN